MDDRLKVAKSKLSVQDLWQYYQLPGVPSRSCRSPFREDRHPSFSVSEDGQFWNDFGTGDHGDQIGFIATAEGISLKEACHRILELTSTGTASSRGAHKFAGRPKKLHATSSIQKRLHASVIRKLRDGSLEELEALIKLRKFPVWGVEGLSLLQKRGMLRFLDADDTVYWCITDSSHRNLQVRRLDGDPCHVGDREVKAKTWPGSKATWPIGLDQVSEFDSVVILEGGPDLLAAAIFCVRELPELVGKIGFLCITGASMRLSREVAAKLNGKAITIVEHADRAGKRASRNWGKQLTTGTSTNLLTFRICRDINQTSINDLADFVASGMSHHRGLDRLKMMISRKPQF